MWNKEFDAISDEINKESEKYIKDMIDRVYELFLVAIVRNVYNYYQPIAYKRDYQLLKSVVYEVEYNGIDTVLKVFIDTDLLNYTSAKDGRNVSEAVPYWVNNGHKYRNYTPPAGRENNQFHNYTPRNYLKLAKELVEKEFDVKVEIINDKPNRV